MSTIRRTRTDTALVEHRAKRDGPALPLQDLRMFVHACNHAGLPNTTDVIISAPEPGEWLFTAQDDVVTDISSADFPRDELIRARAEQPDRSPACPDCSSGHAHNHARYETGPSAGASQ